MNEFVTDKEIEDTTKLLKNSLKKPRILDKFNAFMFSRNIDVDKQILILMNRGTNINGIGYYHILFYLIKNGFVLGENAERRLIERLKSLEKYNLITKISIETVSEKFYKIKK